MARLLVVLCHDQDRRVVRLAAVPVALPDLQGEGEVQDGEQVQHRAQQRPLPDANSTSTTSDTWPSQTRRCAMWASRSSLATVSSTFESAHRMATGLYHAGLFLALPPPLYTGWMRAVLKADGNTPADKDMYLAERRQVGLEGG
jgi:hypothetical protein